MSTTLRCTLLSPPQPYSKPSLPASKETLLTEEIRKTQEAYQLFLSKPKTEDSYETYFTQIDRLEELTRPSYVIRDLRLSGYASVYLQAKMALENQGQSAFDGKALTDPELIGLARMVVSYLDSLPRKLQGGTKPLGDHLFAFYNQFGKFCCAGMTHAARTDPACDFALAKTHKNSIALFKDALLTLIQKNKTSKQEILSSLENGEERYLFLLPLLALYHLRHTEASIPEIFQPLAEELTSLTVAETDLSDLYTKFLSAEEQTFSELEKKSFALLAQLPKKENELLTGIMGLAVKEAVKTLK